MAKDLDGEEGSEPGEEVWEEAPRPRGRKVTREWLWEMNEVVGKMSARDDIEVHVYEHYDPVSLFVLEQAESSLGIAIPDQVRSFYEVTDGLDLRWSWRRDDELIPGGEVRMHGFGTVFGSWIDTIWGRASAEEPAAVDFSWELRGVEDQVSWDADWMTVLHVPENLPLFQLYFHNPDEQTLMLDLDFLDYCEALIDTRGVYGWQFLATQADFEERPKVRAHAESALRMMDEVFPEVDMSRFREMDD